MFDLFCYCFDFCFVYCCFFISLCYFASRFLPESLLFMLRKWFGMHTCNMVEDLVDKNVQTNVQGDFFLKPYFNSL